MIKALQLAMVVIARRVRFIIGVVIIAIVPFNNWEKDRGLIMQSLQRVVSIIAPAVGNSLVGNEQIWSHDV